MARDASATGPGGSSSVALSGAIGGLAGVTLTAHRGARAAAAGAVLGAVGLGASEAVARSRQQPGEIPPMWQRIAVRRRWPRRSAGWAVA
jgi:hypothetical protein